MKLFKIGILSLMVGFVFLNSAWAQGPRNRRPDPPPGIENPDLLFLTPDQEQAVLEYLKQNYPDRLAEAEQLKRRKPQNYQRALSRAFREMRFGERLKNEDPERYKRLKEEKDLENQSRILAKSYQNATSESEKEKIEAELKAVLEKSFDLRQMNRADEIAKLEERLLELREKNNEREANQKRIIELRLQELLGKQTLSW